jgi:hypothetical protein
MMRLAHWEFMSRPVRVCRGGDPLADEPPTGLLPDSSVVDHVINSEYRGERGVGGHKLYRPPRFGLSSRYVVFRRVPSLLSLELLSNVELRYFPRDGDVRFIP